MEPVRFAGRCQFAGSLQFGRSTLRYARTGRQENVDGRPQESEPRASQPALIATILRGCISRPRVLNASFRLRLCLCMALSTQPRAMTALSV